MKIVGMGLFLTLSFACKKDDNSSDCLKLEGDWQCVSWAEEGQELIGNSALIISADIHFKDLMGTMGDYELNINYLIGGSEFIIGAYTVNTTCDQVTLTPKAGIATTFDFSYEGDKLIMKTSVIQEATIIQFRKE
jgi:hypothetical protein